MQGLNEERRGFVRVDLKFMVIGETGMQEG